MGVLWPFPEAHAQDCREDLYSLAVRRGSLRSLIPLGTDLSGGRAEQAPWTPPDQTAAASEKFDLKGALLQSLEYTLFQHAVRVAVDPGLRYQLAHQPFVHDWFASYAGYNLHRWGDGDDFIVNDVSHPFQGAVYGRLFLQNSPHSQVGISRTSRYWVSRLKAAAWAAVWEVQWRVGPLSETSFGNAGGWIYVPGCGTDPGCLNNPRYPKPPTNNTGLSDWVMTPLGGLLWIVGEDTLDRYIVSRVARNHPILGGKIMRASLEPTRGLAALFAGKLVWQLPQLEDDFVARTKPKPPKAREVSRTAVDHWEIGAQYTAISLPVVRPGCVGCRQYNSGAGTSLDYNLTRSFSFDSSLNVLPAQGGSKGMMEGLFGCKLGERFRHWGVFGRIRPGFIYYQEAMPGGGVSSPTSLSRFATDFGGTVEVYPSHKSALRIDVGTTLVRYLTDRRDLISPLGSLLSTQYIVTQGNFQISTSYGYRF